MSMFNTPLPRAQQPVFHEGSDLRSNRDSDVTAKLWQKNRTSQAQNDSYGIAIAAMQRELGKLRRRRQYVDDSASRRWQEPYKELDPSVDVAKGTWVYISEFNPLVTTGLTDMLTENMERATPGIWEAVQAVPKAVDGSYNVPGANYYDGGVTGDPLRGDLDESSVYWVNIRDDSGSDVRTYMLKSVGAYHLVGWEVRLNTTEDGSYSATHNSIWTESGWDDSAEAVGINVTIAKNVDVWPVAEETIASDDITYTYTSSAYDARTAEIGAESVDEVVVPYYVPDQSIIVASPVLHTGVYTGTPESEVRLMEFSPRAWAQKWEAPA